MLTAAIRVVTRSAAIQLEEAAAIATHHQKTLSGQETGQAAHVEPLPAPSEGQGTFPQTQTLSERLDKHGGRTAGNANNLTALDRLIQNAPRAPPPPAPNTHPADKGHGIPPPLSWKAAGVTGHMYANVEFAEMDRPAKTGPSPIDALIGAAPRSPPPPAGDKHPVNKHQSTVAEESALDPLHTTPEVQTIHAKPLEDTTTPTLSPAPQTNSIDKPPPQPVPHIVQELEAAAASKSIEEDLPLAPEEDDDAPVVLRASKVPSSRIGRLFHYGSLAASLSWGAASESVRRSTGGTKNEGSVFMSDANVRRLVSTLGRMRGAALKLGQFMSIQDNHMLPPEIEKVLHQVQSHANYMPEYQLTKVLSTELTPEWPSLFSSFEKTPIAAASIGQVHRGTWKDERQVAVKVQFPGVAESIESDLGNLSLLLRTSALLPPGLYLQNTIAVMRRELQDECDYVKEADACRKFGQYLKDDPFFVVPKVIEEGTSHKVLTTEWMSGKPLSRVKNLDKHTRDLIGTNILRLCLLELFQFRLMQTDPNWGNFLYTSSPSPSIQLIDFGATREYTKEFMDGWYRLLTSALRGDREQMRVESLALGYLTGDENETMLEAHLDSMALVGSPFSHQGTYSFADQTITDSIRALIPVMLKHRLTPPPEETYSLNRKLSGAFLMCAKLGAEVDCAKLWEEVVGDYKEG